MPLELKTETIIVPLRGRIIVEVLNDSKRTDSGLWLPNVNEEVPHRGIVMAMGGAFIDSKGCEHPWGFQCGHIAHFKRVWDQNKVKNYILKREQIYAIEHQEKAYAIADYIIVKKDEEPPSGIIFIPNHFDVKVEKQTGYGIVTSVGKEDRLGLKVGDRVMYFRTEGLSVRIPLQEELWALKPRGIIGTITS